jgi:hypothetical protein
LLALGSASLSYFSKQFVFNDPGYLSVSAVLSNFDVKISSLKKNEQGMVKVGHSSKYEYIYEFIYL